MGSSVIDLHWSMDGLWSMHRHLSIGGRIVPQTATRPDPDRRRCCCCAVAGRCAAQRRRCARARPRIAALSDPVRLRCLSLIASRRRVLLVRPRGAVGPVAADDQPPHQGPRRSRADRRREAGPVDVVEAVPERLAAGSALQEHRSRLSPSLQWPRCPTVRFLSRPWPTTRSSPIASGLSSDEVVVQRVRPPRGSAAGGSASR